MFTTEYKGLRMLVQHQANQQFPRAKQKPILGIEMWTVSFVPWIWIHKWGVKHLFFFFSLLITTERKWITNTTAKYNINMLINRWRGAAISRCQIPHLTKDASENYAVEIFAFIPWANDTLNKYTHSMQVNSLSTLRRHCFFSVSDEAVF